MRWERVGQALPRSAQVVGNLLVIPAVEAQDGGTYRCVASNIAGSVFAQIVLLIEGHSGSYNRSIPSPDS